MSQLSDIQGDLGQWLQDTVNVQWPADRTRRAINLALRETEKHILAVDPEAFKCTYTAATVVPSTGKDNLYTYPAGTFAVHEIALSSDGVAYVPLERLSLRVIRDKRAGDQAAGPGFVPYDTRHFILWPSASTAVTSALRIIVAPTLVMADATDENPVPPAFEMLMMKEAQKICLYDVGEPTDDIQKEINAIKSETPRFYLTTTAPSFIVPLQNREY